MILCFLAFSFLKQSLRELFGVERLQIIRLLAEADEFDGQAEFLLDRHHHAAFARAVELGHDEAGERDGFVEFARLVQRIHAGAAVEYEQDFVRRAGQLLPDDAVELVQLLHEVVFGVQSARSVNEEVISLARLRGSDSVVRHGCGICTIRAGDDLDLETRAPKFELFDGRSAEGVARSEQHGFLLRLDVVRELGGGRGLARAVHADDGNHRRAARGFEQIRFVARKALLNFCPRDGEVIQSRRAL